MAVLKYKSGNEIKTMGLIKSGVTGVSSVNGKTGAVTGLYDTNNQPPYPVTSVNGKTGDVNIEFVNGVAYSVGQSVSKGLKYIHSIPINQQITGESVKSFVLSFNVGSNFSILPISAFSPNKGGVGITLSNRSNGVNIMLQNYDVEVIYIENITIWLYSLIDCTIAGVSQE